MTLQQEIAALQARIAAAHAERDSWRATGMQEKYLEAHSMVEALELKLDALRQEGLRATVRNERPVERDLTEVRPVTGDRERLMSALAIAYDGRQYHYDRYRYDRLEDAVDYATLRQSLPAGEAALPMPAPRTIEAPDPSQREVMSELAITFHEGIYRLGNHRYTDLNDAVNYARLLRTQGREAD